MAESYVSPERAALTACRRLARMRHSRLRDRIRRDAADLRRAACEQAGCEFRTLPAAAVAVPADDAVTIAFLPVVSTIVTTRGQEDEPKRSRTDRGLLSEMQDPACAAVFGG